MDTINNQRQDSQQGDRSVTPNTDPIEMAKKIVQIESDVTQGISAIAEILVIIAQGKSDLEQIKLLTKERLSSLINEQTNQPE